MTAAYKSPFPYFGGKSSIAADVWSRLGQDAANYIEPFFGSGAMLFGRPGFDPAAPWIETVNDKDGFVANFWRAVQADPDQVAHYADWPVNENDLHARHIWLVNNRAEMVARLEGDPGWYDARRAGWWVWGISCWIGGGWCSGNGPWQVNAAGELVKGAGHGVNRKLVHLGGAGRGVNRKLVHLGGAGHGERGLGEAGLLEWMRALSERLERVRVASGDWSRITVPTVTYKHGLTAVFLDPPYSAEAGRDGSLYAEEDLSVAHEVRAWCLANGDNPLLRIAICGYRGEHDELEARGWLAWGWRAHGGYGNLGGADSRGLVNREREVVWFSPHCLIPDAAGAGRQAELWGRP